MARQPRSTGRQHGTSRYSLATQRAQGRTNLQPTISTAGRCRRSIIGHQAPSNQGLAVKQEELDNGIDVNATHIIQFDDRTDVDGPPLWYKRKQPYPPLCRKHRKPLEYIHRPLVSDSAPKYKVKEIHLKEGQTIVRGEPSMHYIDEFSNDSLWGNEVTLCDQNVRTLRSVIKNKKTPNYYYVCRRTKTFATPGKRMYFDVHYSRNSLFPHMYY